MPAVKVGLEIGGKPPSVSQPGTADSNKLRAWTDRGMGSLGEESRLMQRLFRTEEEGGRPAPHVITVDDVTRGLGLEETDRERIHRLLTETRADYGMESARRRMPRIGYALSRLSDFLQKTERFTSDQRMEIRRRASTWWRKYGHTTYEGRPMIRHLITKSQLRSPTLLKGGPYVGPRGGKWADPQHTIPWSEPKGKPVKSEHGAHATTPEEFASLFDKLKTNQRIEVSISAVMGHGPTETGTYTPMIVARRTTSKKYGSTTLHLRPADGRPQNPMSRVSLYKHRNGQVYAAIGDMGVSLKGIKTDSFPAAFRERVKEGIKKSEGQQQQPKSSGGPFIGPRGGKWADPEHTVPYTDIEKYKLRVSGKDHEATAKKIEAGIGQAADICKITPPICEGNLGIERKDMPQLPDEVIPDFLKTFQDQGIQVTKGTMKVGQLKATQREINADKVQGMAQAYKEGKYDPSKAPIIVSKDGYVLDGHHRWAAMLHDNPGNEMRVYKVDTDIKTLLKAAQNHKGVNFGQGFGAASDIKGKKPAGEAEDVKEHKAAEQKEDVAQKSMRMRAQAAAIKDSYLLGR